MEFQKQMRRTIYALIERLALVTHKFICFLGHELVQGFYVIDVDDRFQHYEAVLVQGFQRFLNVGAIVCFTFQFFGQRCDRLGGILKLSKGLLDGDGDHDLLFEMGL